MPRNSSLVTQPLRRGLAATLTRLGLWRPNSSSLERPPTWRRPAAFIVEIVFYLLALIFVALIVQAVVDVIIARDWVLPVNTRCDSSGTSCGILSGFIMPILTVAFGSALFIFFRLHRMQRRYKRRVLRDPRKFVPTAGSIIGEVVGRDELCTVVMQNLRDRRIRRAHVIVGGVGAGKTAVLVRMNELLAEYGAVPLPVMLREAGTSLDFRELARNKFCTEVAVDSIYTGEDERAWRRLGKAGKIVVLADGLEEALIDNENRNSLIRLAIERANEQRLPLVIASRPHDPLRNLAAATIELEPLSEEAALKYVKNNSITHDADRLDWIVETADVAAEPLYLQITRQLHQKGFLEHIAVAPNHKPLEIRGADRTKLRIHLLDTWTDALIEGHFRQDNSINIDDRKTAIECISALALIGLKYDSVDVKFADLIGELPQAVPPPGTQAGSSEMPGPAGEVPGPAGALPLRKRHAPHQPIVDELKHRLGHSPDIQVAASWAQQLGLVEIHGDGVRFQHSILQAYFGSRLMSFALQDSAYRYEVGQKLGREFLIAVVMYFRTLCSEAAAGGGEEAAWASVNDVLGFLSEAAKIQEAPAKRLDIYAAQFEIDAAANGDQHPKIAQTLSDDWSRNFTRGDKILEEAKLGLVHRFGEALRNVPEPAYDVLYDIAKCERYYPVRLAIAQEIAPGGQKAYEKLKVNFNSIFQELEKSSADGSSQDATARSRKWREQVMAAWLAPLLAWSGPDEDGDDQRNLARWLNHLGKHEAETHIAQLPITLEIALAQGFKHAANRRPRASSDQSGTREWLADQAMEMLKRSRFWFSHLTLLHALCLWELPDSHGGDGAPARSSADIEAMVKQWLTAAGTDQADREKATVKQRHPFVVAASEFVILALKSRHPEKYVWIDETGVISTVGSHGEGPAGNRKHHLWIPPSTGWSVLDSKAQQLVADVLLLLNLAERGESPEDHDRRLGFTQRAGELPPCLSEDRSFLDPGRSLGTPGSAAPGSHCKGGCNFKLCPYPPRGGPSYRVELSEPFCRRQALLARYSAATAKWQNTSARNLNEFWMKMAERARGATPGD